MKYEYKILVNATPDILDSEGQYGWKLVSVFVNKYQQTDYVMVRNVFANNPKQRERNFCIFTACLFVSLSIIQIILWKLLQ